MQRASSRALADGRTTRGSTRAAKRKSVEAETIKPAHDPSHAHAAKKAARQPRSHSGPPSPPHDLIAAGSRVDVRRHDDDAGTWHTGVVRSTRHVLRLIEGTEALGQDFLVDFDDEEPMHWCSRSTHDIREAVAMAEEVDVASERDGTVPERGMEPAAYLYQKTASPRLLRGRGAIKFYGTKHTRTCDCS